MSFRTVSKSVIVLFGVTDFPIAEIAVIAELSFFKIMLVYINIIFDTACILVQITYVIFMGGYVLFWRQDSMSDQYLSGFVAVGALF